jgi:hypothetical protein
MSVLHQLRLDFCSVALVPYLARLVLPLISAPNHNRYVIVRCAQSYEVYCR